MKTSDVPVAPIRPSLCFMWQAVRIRMFLARQSIKKERPGENFPCRPPVS